MAQAAEMTADAGRIKARAYSMWLDARRSLGLASAMREELCRRKERLRHLL
jgi:hypothetical protein